MECLFDLHHFLSIFVLVSGALFIFMFRVQDLLQMHYNYCFVSSIFLFNFNPPPPPKKMSQMYDSLEMFITASILFSVALKVLLKVVRR